MLTDKKVKAFVITTDAVAAKKFYGKILGFKFLNEDDYGLEFEMNNSLLRVSITSLENAEPQKKYGVGLVCSWYLWNCWIFKKQRNKFWKV